MGALHPFGVQPGRLVDDVGPEEREFGAGLMLEQPLEAVVELVVAVRRGIETPRVLHIDRGSVLEQARVGRRCADVVTGGEQQGTLGEGRGVLVEHRGELCGSPDRHVQSVDRRGRRIELTVEVVEAEQRHQRA